MDKISQKAVETYNAASKATGKLARELKLKAKMSENKRKIQELYEDIGKIAYEKYVLKQEINVQSDILDNCSMIDILADEIEDMRMELLKLKDLKQCPKCHYEIYYDFNFCPNCGYVQEQNENETDQNSTAIIETTDEKDETLEKHIENLQEDNDEDE